MENKTCHKCGKKLKVQKTGIKIPLESHNPSDVYDGNYKEIKFKYCLCWKTK